MHDFSHLNPSQKKAVCHGSGPALVLAGPGSGKTYLMVNRIRYLTENCQAAPENILVITFTKAAARSLQQRFSGNTGQNGMQVFFATFHSFFFQLLRKYSLYDTNSLIKTEEKLKYMEAVLAEKRTNLSPNSASARDFLKSFGIYKNNPEAFSDENLPADIKMQDFLTVFSAYQQLIGKERKLDFDDMPFLCLQLLKEKKSVLESCRRQFTHILVDEYQDTNSVQYEILKLLAAPGNNIFAVGDDDQAIYGFRGSTPGIMQDFLKQYPEASLYRLDVNYRSTPAIVKASLRMIEENKTRFSKNIKALESRGEPVTYLAFEKSEEEYQYIAQRLARCRETWTYQEMAVLCRTNRVLESIAEILEEAEIPYQMKEPVASHYESPAVRELVSCLYYCQGQKKREPAVWKTLKGDIRQKELLKQMSPYAAIHYIRNRMEYDAYLKFRLKDSLAKAEEYLQQLDCLGAFALKFNSTREWLAALEKHISGWQRLAAQGQTAQKETQEPGVNLMTIHASKGLEFSYVCISDVNEGILPGKNIRNPELLEEERRMLYVGMTRAKKALDILYLTGTKESPRLPSRFLNPLLNGADRYYGVSTTSSNSALSKNSSKASATSSYSPSSSMNSNSGSALGSFSSSL